MGSNESEIRSGLSFDLVQSGLNSMARMMQGGKTINQHVVEDWMVQLNKRGVTPTLFNQTVDRVIESEDRFPSLKIFCDVMYSMPSPEGEGSFFAYDCECHHCRYGYSVPVDNRYTPQVQSWKCGHCGHSQNVWDSLSYRQPSAALSDEMKEQLKRLFAKKYNRTYEGVVPMLQAMNPPSNREGIITAVKSLLVEEYEWAAKNNQEAMEAVDLWENAIATYTDAALQAALTDLIKHKEGANE